MGMLFCWNNRQYVSNFERFYKSIEDACVCVFVCMFKCSPLVETSEECNIASNNVMG